MSSTQTRVQTLQVLCTTKRNRSDHEVISHLGGSGWYSLKAEVVAAIEAGTHRFYTEVGSQVAWLRVVRGRYGKYVQSYGDGVPNNNLLNLRDC